MRSLSKTFIAMSVLLAACGEGDPEADVVSAFLSAVQKSDQAGVQRVSLTPFEGSPVSWEILERGEESEGPFHLADLEEQLNNKRNEVRVQKEELAAFISDNRETYESYKTQYAANPSAPFQGELAKFHEARQERLGRLAQLEADAEQLAFDVEALKSAATLSLSTPVDTSFEGQVKMKPLQVRINDGSEDKTYTVVLQRYELVDTGQNRTPIPRWIIAEIQPHS